MQYNALLGGRQLCSRTHSRSILEHREYWTYGSSCTYPTPSILNTKDGCRLSSLLPLQRKHRRLSAKAACTPDAATPEQDTLDGTGGSADASSEADAPSSSGSAAQALSTADQEAEGSSPAAHEQGHPGNTPQETPEQASSSGEASQTGSTGVYPGREAGYTPFEYVTFSENQMTHEVTLEVDAPVSKVFQIWRNRLNYNEWFDLIGQLMLHKGDSNLASYFFFYKWGQLPALELYTTLSRQSEEENSAILEQSVDGMDMAVGVFFEELGPNKTEVSLRLGYLLPANLACYVGPVGIWADVNEILQENMLTMKEFVESVDLEALEAARTEDKAALDEKLNQLRDVSYAHEERQASDQAGAASAPEEVVSLKGVQDTGKAVQEVSTEPPKRRRVSKKKVKKPP